MTRRALRVGHIVLSLGLCLVLERLRVDRRWLWLLWAVVALNELRGLAVVWLTGRELFCAASQISLAFCAATP